MIGAILLVIAAPNFDVVGENDEVVVSVTDTPVTDTPVTDTPVTDTPVTDTPVTTRPTPIRYQQNKWSNVGGLQVYTPKLQLRDDETEVTRSRQPASRQSFRDNILRAYFGIR